MKKWAKSWKAGIACLFAAALLCGLFPAVSAEKETEQRVVRVGFPVQAGLSEIDEQGNLSGYSYEYLEEIAQYTGWNYEFVTLEGEGDEVLEKMLEMLKSGELDILGAMAYSESLAEIFDYPGYSYGTAYTTVEVLESNRTINESSLSSWNGMRIAVMRNAKVRMAELNQFCESNHVQPELVYCDDIEEPERMLAAGEVDAILNRDVNVRDGVRIIAKFAPSPFYFAVTKGKSDLVAGLDFALLKIEETDPYFAPTLYHKYFETNTFELVFNADETAYLESADVLRVGVDIGKTPVQYRVAETGEFEGISRDIFSYLEEKTGLRFEYVFVNSQEELSRMLNEGQLDLASALMYDYETANEYNVAMTRPYLSTQITLAMRNELNPESIVGKRLALPRGLVYSGTYEGKVTWYDNIEECLAAVASGEQDYCYGNGYTLQYYVNQREYRNLQLIPQSGFTQQFCIGVAKPVNPNLLTLLNKTIRSIPDSELQAMIYRNTFESQRAVSLADYIDANPRQIVFGVTVISLLLLGLLAGFLLLHIRSSRRIALDNERYRQLNDLSNEYLFEYDFLTDTVLLSEKCANVFHASHILENFMTRLKARTDSLSQEQLAIWRRILEQRGGTEEINLTLPDQSTRWVRVTVKVISDKNGKPTYAVGKIVDIQKEVQEREQLQQKALTDSLTGLYNSAATRQLAEERALGAPPCDKGALFILDIDHFKEVNDCCGHYTGDLVLVELARILRETFRQEDVVGRVGGDEFLIYMEHAVRPEAIAEKCESLRGRVKRMPPVGQISNVSVSIGVAVVHADETDFNVLYQRADEALYLVKNRGRDGYEIFE